MKATKNDVMLVAIVGILAFLIGIICVVIGAHTGVSGLAGTGAVTIGASIVLMELAVIGYFGVKRSKQ